MRYQKVSDSGSVAATKLTIKTTDSSVITVTPHHGLGTSGHHRLSVITRKYVKLWKYRAGLGVLLNIKPTTSRWLYVTM